MEEIEYTKDQTTAFEEIKEWLQSDETFKVLKGYAGTGKTTLLDGIVQHAKSIGFHTVVTAPTNKAVKVLNNRVSGFNHRTIHSLLDIKPKRKGGKEVFEPVDFPNAEVFSIDLIIVDECSMVSNKLFGIIKDKIQDGTKVLFCGDPAQLQPVNEDLSSTFEHRPSELDEIIRYGDTIAQKAKHVRENPKEISLSKLMSPPDIVEGNSQLVNDYFSNWRDTPNNARMLCWTNKRVEWWNKKLREVDYGYKPDEPYTEGDILIANEPVEMNDEIVMMNSEEGTILEVEERNDAWKITLKKETGGRCRVRIVKEEYKQNLKNDLNKARRNKNWSKFWALKGKYHDVRHAYALTVHKSQGSTFTKVFMDSGDISKNRDILERNQLIYVAMTRASNKVIIY